MSLVNRALFMGTLAYKKVTGGSCPLVVVLNVTNRCNIACGYCYGQFFNPPKQDAFTTEEIFSLLDELGSLGARSITLGGGEPLLRKDIGEIVERAKLRGMEVGFNTNGLMVEKRLEALKKADTLCISLDGPKEMNDANRGEGTFEKIMAGLEQAIAAGLKVHTTTVITKHNTQAIDWIVNLAKEKGFQAEFNFLFHQTPDKSDSDNFMASNEELRQAALKVADLKAAGAPILFSESVYRYVSQWPDFRKRLYAGQDQPEFDFPPCEAGRFMVFIDADGRVYPCVQLIDGFQAQDFRKVGFKAAWDACRDHGCKACYFPCFNEFNKIFELNPRVIAGQVLSTLKGH